MSEVLNQIAVDLIKWQVSYACLGKMQAECSPNLKEIWGSCTEAGWELRPSHSFPHIALCSWPIWTYMRTSK